MPDLGGDEDGQTPVDLDDAQYLTVAHAKIGTRAELNDAEAANSEISIRFHHRLVFIHPFVNGNGRHARLAAGALAAALGLGSDHLSWGARSGLAPADARIRYLTALRAADRGGYTELLINAVS